MPSPYEWLRRLRPAAAPGPAAPAGVPADRVAELDAELAPVFEALRDTVAAAAEIVAAAEGEAERRRTAASAEEAALRAAATRQAAAAEAEAAAGVARALDEERARVLADAHREADAVAGRARTRLPAVVARVVGAVDAVDQVGNVDGVEGVRVEGPGP